MSRKITERQLTYLNILLDKAFGHNRKLYLKEFCGVESSKDLTLLEASDIIERFVPKNENREKNIANARHKMMIMSGQKTLI